MCWVRSSAGWSHVSWEWVASRIVRVGTSCLVAFVVMGRPCGEVVELRTRWVELRARWVGDGWTDRER